jgi:hypothetical protein
MKSLYERQYEQCQRNTKAARMARTVAEMRAKAEPPKPRKSSARRGRPVERMPWPESYFRIEMPRYRSALGSLTDADAGAIRHAGPREGMA